MDKTFVDVNEKMEMFNDALNTFYLRLPHLIKCVECVVK